MANEHEIVQHPKISYTNLFIVALEYRTPHLHRDFEFNLVLEGDLEMRVNGEKVIGQPGDLLLLNPNQPHELLTHGDIGATLLCMQISPKFFKDTFPVIASTYFDVVKIAFRETSSHLKECLKNFIELAIAYMDRRTCYQLYCVARLNENFYTLLENVPHHFLTEAEQQSLQWKVDRIARLLDFVDANYMRKINLRDFAKVEGLSLNHMSYFVKENLNQTFRDYVATVRYHQAVKLLLTEDMPLIDICLEAGFSDTRYLREVFLAKTDMRPEEYKLKCKARKEAGLYRHSLHSSEKFYSEEEAVRILSHIKETIGKS